MSTCHQAHNIPWEEFADCLHINIKSSNNKDRISLVAKKEPWVTKKIQHFIACFVRTVKEFSATERTKYDNSKIDSMTEVYTAEQCDNDILLEGPLQNIDTWKRVANREFGYNDGNMADVVKAFFNKNMMYNLLHLARCMGKDLYGLKFVTYSNLFHYGFSRTLSFSLQWYVHLNLLIATNRISSVDKWHKQFWSLRNTSLSGEDYDGHNRVVCEFLRGNEDLNDPSGIKEHMKHLFRCLYQYDMFVNEMGVEFSWEDELKEFLSLFEFKLI